MARSDNLDAPTRHDHRRHSCDDLLAEPYDSERDERPLDEQGLLGRRSEEDHAEELEAEIVRRRQQDRCETLRRRAAFIRTLALLCACCLSIGSH